MMTDKIFELLDCEYGKYPMLAGTSVSIDEINDFEKAVGFNLPDIYKKFVLKYGGGIVGAYSICGLNAAPEMGKIEGSALALTKYFCLQRWPGVDQWLVISMDLSGNPIGMDSKGAIWIADHDSNDIKLLANDFEDFLINWCLKNTED